MAGATNIHAAPYPNGPFIVRMGGTVINGRTAQVVDTFVLPFDCKINSVYYSYSKGAADLDDITFKTVDATALTIVATLANPSADIAGVKQTLHADVVGVVIKAGNKLQITADSQGTSPDESGIINVTVLLDPEYTRPQGS